MVLIGIVLAWLVVCLLVVALCVAARLGDAAMAGPEVLTFHGRVAIDVDFSAEFQGRLQLAESARSN